MRIETLYPEIQWDTVWENLKAAWIPNKIKTTWYQVIHDIEPTNDGIAKIKLRDEPLCNFCSKTDTILHRMTECNATANIWKWTRELVAQILRTTPRNINPKWTKSPDFNFWPPQRKQAILWIIAHMVYYCVNNWQQLKDTDYADFLQFKLGNACYYSVQNLLSFSLLSKNLNIKIYRTIILPVVLYGCETWWLTLREERRLRGFENRVLRRVFGPNRDEITGKCRLPTKVKMESLPKSATKRADSKLPNST